MIPPPIAALIVLLLALPPTMAAQDSLTLARALELARENNPRLQAADKGADAATLAHDEILKGRLPTVAFKGAASYAPTFPSFGYDPALTNGGQLGAQVVVQQVLSDGGQRDLRASQSQLDIGIVNAERGTIGRDLLLGVRLAFIDALHARDQIRLQETSIRQLSDYLLLVQSMYAGSLVLYTDVLKTRIRVADAQRSLLDARDAADTSRLALCELTGLPPDTMFAVAGDLDTTTSAAGLDLAGSPDVLALDRAIQRGQIDVELARRENRPIISAFADAGALTSEQNIILPRSERSSFVGASIGINVDIPILNWGITDLHIAQQQIAVDTLQLQAGLLKRSLARQHAQIRLQIARDRERLAVIQATIADAENNFLLSKSKYAGAAGSALEVLDAQQLLMDNRLAELQTLADMATLAARLERLTSK